MSTIGDIFTTDPVLIDIASQSKAAVDRMTSIEYQINDVSAAIARLDADLATSNSSIVDNTALLSARITSIANSGAPSADINDDPQCRAYTVLVRQSQTAVASLTTSIARRTTELGDAQSALAEVQALLISLRAQTIARMDVLRGL